jgi:hypothetical protein
VLITIFDRQSNANGRIVDVKCRPHKYAFTNPSNESEIMQQPPYWPIDAQPALQAAALSSARKFVTRRLQRSRQQETADSSRSMSIHLKTAALLQNHWWVLPDTFSYSVCMGEAAGQPAAAARCQLFHGRCTCSCAQQRCSHWLERLQLWPSSPCV